MKITVIKGGTSAERDVSLRTGTAIEKALKELGHEVSVFDPKTDSLEFFFRTPPEVAFIALHGKGGEDGSLQGFFQSLRIPYTGSGVASSALCYDKITTKLVLKNFGIPSPDFFVLLQNFLPKNLAELRQKIKYPVIVKPSREGSTFGISVARQESELDTAIANAKNFCPDILIESFITGREMTVSILNGRSLPVVEIAPKKGFFDYAAKYTPGETEYFTPARISDAATQKLQETTAAAYHHLGCRGQARADFILDAEDGIHFLEINTIPGMTETSLLPKAAKAVGMDFKQLCAAILESAKLD